MAEELFCNSTGCTLHDYPVNPAFCEYLWSQDQVRREREANHNDQIAVIERVAENVSTRLIEAVYDLFQSRTTELPYDTTDRDAETPSNANKKNREGGISI